MRRGELSGRARLGSAPELMPSACAGFASLTPATGVVLAPDMFFTFSVTILATGAALADDRSAGNLPGRAAIEIQTTEPSDAPIRARVRFGDAVVAVAMENLGPSFDALEPIARGHSIGSPR